jgi:hypothetical protein
VSLQDKYRNPSPTGVVPAASIYDGSRPARPGRSRKNGRKRDREILAVLLGCTLRSSELAALRCPVCENGSAGGNKGTGISPGCPARILGRHPEEASRTVVVSAKPTMTVEIKRCFF